MPESKRPLTFCYIGINEPRWARDTVLVEGLKRRGATIILCTDSSPGLKKYRRIARQLWRLRGQYDYMLVGYLSNIVVPLAWIFGRRPLIYNAGNSMYEGSVIDRGHRSWLKKERYLWLIDWLAFHLADLVSIETEAQKDFIARLFWVPRRKMFVSFAGADDRIFSPNSTVSPRSGFWVLFRGWLIPATGVEYVLAAASLLRDQGVNFLLIGRGFQLGMVERIIREQRLGNVELITKFLPEAELKTLMHSCQIMLGQFSGHPRLERTIQNKTFEALALGVPYITQRSASNCELLRDSEHCLFVRPTDSVDLAAKILALKADPALRRSLGEAARRQYLSWLTPEHVADRLLGALEV